MQSYNPYAIQFHVVLLKDKKNKRLRLFFKAFPPNLICVFIKNFAIYDNVFVKFTCSEIERLLVLVSWWRNKALLDTQ